MSSDSSGGPTSQLFGEQLAFEALGAASIEEHCLTLRGELQGLRTAIESRRQRRASIVGAGGDASRRASRQLQDVAQIQQELRAELVQDFEKRLADMHMQLLAKQHEFEAYRQAMEHELKQQLRAAQPHLVSQLVDKSGVMSVETKTTFLESLHGQVELERLQKENVRFKQTILKLQTLHDMQRQLHEIESEKDKAAEKSQRMRASQLMNENTALQQRIRALEADVAKATQDKTFFQTKCTELQKQNELAAQRRREAKVRALSAPYRRRLDGVEEPSFGATNQPPDYEQQQEAFDELHEVRIRSPKQRAASAVDEARRDEHLQNATRHYQNEIKRLQQQLAREMRLKTQLMDQVTQLKTGEGVSTLNDDEPSDEATAGQVIPAASSVQKPPRCVVSASPRVRAASASVCSPRKAVRVAVMAPRRPSTSCSPRVSRQANTSSSETKDAMSQPPMCASPSPARSSVATPTRSGSASAPSTRKFEVHEREPPVVRVGGVAGVQNALSVRERLPYR